VERGGLGQTWQVAPVEAAEDLVLFEAVHEHVEQRGIAGGH